MMKRGGCRSACCPRLGNAVVTARIWVDLGLASTRVHLIYGSGPIQQSDASGLEPDFTGGIGSRWRFGIFAACSRDSLCFTRPFLSDKSPEPPQPHDN